MDLPQADHAIVAREKIAEYLLCREHPDGGSKAEFFSRFGFQLDNWQAFRRALQNHALAHEVATVQESDFGTKYAVECTIQTPDGREPCIRTIWILEETNDAPRLVTAYPQEDVT